MVIELQHINMFFGKSCILHDINLGFDHGIYGILGPNGAGKTTLISIMVGLLKPSSGSVLFHGKNILDKSSDYLRYLGFLSQFTNYYNNFTAIEFLEYFSVLKGIKGRNREQINLLLEYVNLSDVKTKKLGSFSGGMLRRIGLAQTLLGNPEIIVLDEPTSGLDPLERIRLRNLLTDVSKNRTVIIATHIVPDIEYIANKVILLFNGHVKAFGPSQCLINDIKDKVWNLCADYSEKQVSQENMICNLAFDGINYNAKIISDTKPSDNAKSISPCLEDVFMYLSLDEKESIQL